MLKVSFMGLVLLIASSGDAATNIVFSSDKATVIVQGTAGDTDAPTLFAAMSAPAVDNGATLKKQITFVNSAGQSLFDLSCNLSKTIANYGSCTLQINKIDGMVFDPSTKEVIQSVLDISDATKASKLFSKPDVQTGIIYFSADKRLGISVDFDGGYPELFMIQYK